MILDECAGKFLFGFLDEKNSLKVFEVSADVNTINKILVVENHWVEIATVIG